MSQKLSYFVLPANTTASAAGDAIVKAGYLKIGNATAAWLANLPAALKSTQVNLSGLKNGSYKAYAAEVARVITVTPTAVAGGEYRVTLSAEKNAFDTNLPNEVQTTFTHTAPTGATATTIGDAFRTAINNHPFWGARVTASGTTTLVLTAKAGYPIFTGGVGQYMSLAYTTAGSAQMGFTGAQLLANGFAFNADCGIPLAGTNYDVFIFDVNHPSEVVMTAGVEEQIVFAVSTGGNNAAFITALAGIVAR